METTIIKYIFVIIALVLFIATYLPLINNKYWFFRFFDFGRRQIFILLLLLFVINLLFNIQLNLLIDIVIIALLALALLTQLYYLAPYIVIFSKKQRNKQLDENSIEIISVNVLMGNRNYPSLIRLIKKQRPHILLTMETDEKWDKALSEIESMYPNFKKIPLNNTYGMSLYSTLKVNKIDVHYFISKERPAIEAHLQTKGLRNFVFWGVHPPPPSPTEEETSKKRDNELVIIAKQIRDCNQPVIVAGDFNATCWSKIARLFARISNLKDARKKRGFYSTFPAKPFFLRIPIDLFYHSKNVIVNKLTTLKYFGSDHLPFYIQCEITNT
ncbi:endonuclease/exonuclease/phosphatase family protein [Maribellus comscasis]|uniref:Endonuclease/exonuclease/phosphatase family protein n=1 Tax=Maribellus comscasis TaxID=2681766 RepID=A0A6I6JX31_9BACT|nr:endonuclease/exonuclease/phosphatase family protein [Maribellus comscasis]QGY47696.1 endonuclease/exonuclease/phosphatase family protein [Maribellus comscasis]